MDITIPPQRQLVLVPEVLVGGIGFTAGTSSTITLANTYTYVGSVSMDSSLQGSDTYSLSGKTLTFNATIPAGVLKVYFQGWM